ncbi:MAG: P-loop NTPase [Haloarculaceae archaeon]
MATNVESTDDLRAAVEAALERMELPGTGTDPLAAGLIADVTVHDDERVTVEVVPDRLDDDPAVLESVARTVRAVDGVAGAQVQPAGTDGGADDDAERTPGVASFDHVVAVASTKGGVGKSTVATNLACALAAEADVGLFDADIYGPNVPALLDLSGPVHSTANDEPRPVDAGGMEVMSVGLMAQDGPLAWRGAMAHDALTELFEDTAWAADDVLVIDMPPGTGDTVLTTLQEVPVDGVVVVTTPFHTSVADTRRSLDLFGENDVPVLGVVRNMGSFECPSCGDEHPLFHDEASTAELDVPVLAELPFDPDLQRTPEPGDPPEAFATLATSVLDRVESVWTAEVPHDAVDLRDVPPDARHEAVREEFTDRESGEAFVLVSDRDPAPVREFLADLADVDPDAIAPFEVERATPETWVLHTEHP